MDKKQFVVAILIVSVFIGGFFSWQAYQQKKQITKQDPNSRASSDVQSQNGVPKDGETIISESAQIDTADWKTYRNENLGIEFQYPGDLSLLLDTEPGSSWGTEEEIMEEISLKRDNQPIVWIIHASAEALKKYRSKLQDVDRIAINENEERVSRGEQAMKIGGVMVTRVDSCGFQEMVDCSFIRSSYFFPMKDGTYLITRGDSWWGGKEAVEITKKLAPTLKYIR